MSDCLFCKILAGDIPSEKVYEDEWCYAFNDISPKAPVHILVIPKEHYGSIHQVPENSSDLFVHLMQATSAIIKDKKLEEKGYRLVINSGVDGGQEVDHIHVHLLAGRGLQWPPG